MNVGMNTFRFGYVTKKGSHQLMPRLGEMEFHFAVTVEGRDASELPERVLAAAQCTKLDFLTGAIDPGDFTGFV